VFQVYGDKCWAAALESWLSVNHRTVIKRDALPITFSTLLMTSPPGTVMLNPAELPTLAKDSRIRMHLRSPSSKSAITPENIADLLNEGCLYLCQHAGGIGHCRVVYGIGYPDGKNQMISFMDPIDGNYHNEKFSDFLAKVALTGPGSFVIGTPRP
jgi:hypothetical protein